VSLLFHPNISMLNDDSNKTEDTSSKPCLLLSPIIQPYALRYPPASALSNISEFPSYHMQASSPQTRAWPSPFGTTPSGDSDSGYGSVVTGTPSVAGTDYAVVFTNSPYNSSHTQTPNMDDFAKTPPFPSNSGYQSSFGTFTVSMSPMDSMAKSLGLTQDFVQEFVAFFGDTLIEKSGARKWANHALATHAQEDTEKRLDMLLHDYTIKFASESLRSGASSYSDGRLSAASKQMYQVLRGAAILIRHCRPNVARYFCENAIARPGNAVSLSARLKRPGQHLSLSGFARLVESSTDDMDPENVAPNFSASSTTTNEDEIKIFEDVESFRDTLVSSEVFNELALKLRQMLYHGNMRDMESIQSYMTLTSDPYCCSFELDWSLAEYMCLQYGKQFPSVGAVIVITGSALYAQATTCEKYIEQTWPKSEISLVQELDAFLRRSDVNRGSAYKGTQVCFQCPKSGFRVRHEWHEIPSGKLCRVSAT
jgi:hypothetical protein